MRGRYKKWAVPYLNDHPEFVIDKIDLTDEFYACENLYLEIGAGKGDFVLGMAKKVPGNYLALERDVSICATLAKKVEEEKLDNIKVSSIDFDVLYEELKKLKFKRIYLNFSDPWPKKRQWKRRLTTRDRLSKMYELLLDGGELRIKTDNDSLYEFTIEEAKETKFTNILNLEDYPFDEENDVMSEYERRFRGLGNKIHRLIYKKGE
ncbi:MAG: tRNA (guanosine(46)-N7)-methyltransferase TrmB [Bacilli bacterium]|nr:tRNA (guanosine(46)-N7)-methyltransferase TrmB [Bacilli bacterium]